MFYYKLRKRYDYLTNIELFAKEIIIDFMIVAFKNIIENQISVDN